MPQGSNLNQPRGHKLEHRNKEGKLKNSSSLKHDEGVELWYLICSIFLRTSTKFVHNYDAPGVKSGPLVIGTLIMSRSCTRCSLQTCTPYVSTIILSSTLETLVKLPVSKKALALFTSSFSFSHSVFKRLVQQTRKN